MKKIYILMLAINMVSYGEKSIRFEILEKDDDVRVFIKSGIKKIKNNVFTNSYIVQSGDRLFKTAKKFNLEMEDLLALNNIQDETKATEGQLLKTSQTIEEKKLIKNRDVNTEISDRTKINNKKVINQDEKSSLQISKAKNRKKLTPIIRKNRYYIVKSGDTLYSIARRFNVPLDRLFSINGLKQGAVIEVGQKLKIK